ncbi:MAG: fibronectin type III domain-containing protein, partial [Candidatus Doudnabacteria bacterium]|nr:fibronectin type III domain-containing protein [Candidatus Doudnabacteria bacterium]
SQYRNGQQHSIYVYGIDTSSASISTLLTGSPRTFTLSGTPPPPTPPTAPGTVNNLSVASVTSNSATLSFTEVTDGAGQPAKYDVRYNTPTISWGSGITVTTGTCATPLVGTTIGATKTCTVLGLTPSTQYQFQLVAFRGTLNVDAVFGGLSNVATNTTSTTTPPPPPPAPTVTISVNPTSVTSGSSATLTWSSTNATSCTASGAWSGSGATSGTLSVSPTTTSTYTLTCTGAGGTTSPASTILTVTAPNFDFTLTNGGSRTVNQGSNITNTVTSTVTSGSGTVNFTASGLPTGATASFNPSSCSATCASTVTITTTGSTPVGNSTVTVTGTGGSLVRSTTFNFTVADGTAPTVSVVAPSSTLTGSITLSATTNDNVGVLGVQFKLDGVNLGLEDTSAPYSFVWDTTSATNGTHNITTVARDAAGNITTSSAASVTVNNIPTPPPTPPPPIIPPPTATISVSPSTIIVGQTATLSWSTTNGDNNSVNPNIGTVASSGTRIVSPTATTIYIITVTNTSGTVSQSATITVNPAPTTTPTPPPPAPVIPPVTPPVIPPGTTPALVRADHYPSGTIFKYAGNPTVYIKEGTGTRPITDWSVYVNQVPATRSIVTIPDSVTFSQGEVLGLRNATLIKASNNPTVYLIIDGEKFAFSSAQEFFNHNYNFSNVYSIDDINLVNRIPMSTKSFIRPTGTLFKYANSPAVYFLNTARLKRGYTTIEMFNIWNATLKDVITIPNSETYPDGPIANMPNGILVKGQSSSTIYFVFDGQLRPFNNTVLFDAMGLKQDQVKIFKDADIQLHTIGPSME